MKRPLVGISGRRKAASVLGAPSGFADAPLDIFFAEYATSVAGAGGVPIFLPLDADPADLVDKLDALVIAGGEDVDPSNYQQIRSPQLGPTDVNRDRFELKLTRMAMASDVPVLGICRGQQLLNVALGGTLVQHVDGHIQQEPRAERTHAVDVIYGTRHSELYGTAVRVNSFHHQSVDRLGNGVVAAAVDEFGTVEAIDVPDARAIAVQWHPETFSGDPVFDWLVAEARKGAK